MSSFFNVDNPVFTTLGKICDMLFISIIWAILCIPIVTIGPANTALYYAMVKVIRRERGYVTREFFKSFRLNFKRGAIVGTLITIMYIVLFIDISLYWTQVGSSFDSKSIMLGIFVAITFLLTCVSVYVFPVLSRFDMTVKQLVKAAIYMAMRHLPYTLAMVIITVLGAIAIYLVWILIFILPAVVTLLNSFLMERVLKKYMPQAEGTPEETGKDQWYLE